MAEGHQAIRSVFDRHVRDKTDRQGITRHSSPVLALTPDLRGPAADLFGRPSDRMSGILMCFRDAWSQALLITVWWSPPRRAGGAARDVGPGMSCHAWVSK